MNFRVQPLPAPFGQLLDDLIAGLIADGVTIVNPERQAELAERFPHATRALQKLLEATIEADFPGTLTAQSVGAVPAAQPFVPRTPAEMIEFMSGHFDSYRFANEDGTPMEPEFHRYSLTVHDLLSAFDSAGFYEQPVGAVQPRPESNVSMESLNRYLGRDETESAGVGVQPPPSSPDLHGFKRRELANALTSLGHIESGAVEFIARFVRAALAASPSSTLGALETHPASGSESMNRAPPGWPFPSGGNFGSGG